MFRQELLPHRHAFPSRCKRQKSDCEPDSCRADDADRLRSHAIGRMARSVWQLVAAHVPPCVWRDTARRRARRHVRRNASKPVRPGLAHPRYGMCRQPVAGAPMHSPHSTSIARPVDARAQMLPPVHHSQREMPWLRQLKSLMVRIRRLHHCGE